MRYVRSVPHRQHNAVVLPTHTAHLFQEAVRRAAAALRGGEAVAVPTETVYGLAANALDPAAVERIFAAKGRPAHNPLIVHVASAEMAADCVAEWTPLAGKLARAFWPGPLTVVLPKAARIPAIVTAGGPTVGVRWPSHPFTQALIRECGFPLAAPSANLSNRLSPTTAGHVQAQLGRRVGLIIDGGPCQVGIESTVLDLSCRPARILRPGIIHEQSLQAVDATIGAAGGSPAAPGPFKSPGLLPLHYAPRAPMVVGGWERDADLDRIAAGLPASRAQIHVVAHSRIPSLEGFGRVSVIPHDATAYARALYGELHACDEAGAEYIIVEAPPEGPEWRAIRDRLQRAAAPRPLTSPS